MLPSDPEPPEELGPVEQELVRLLRCLDLSELQPGSRERCWEEFRTLANLPERPPPASPGPIEEPAVPSDTVPVPPARQANDAARRLRLLPRASSARG